MTYLSRKEKKTEEDASRQRQKDCTTVSERKEKDTEEVCESPGTRKLFTCVKLQEGYSITDADMKTCETSPKFRMKL